MGLEAGFSETVDLLRRAKAGEPACLRRVLDRYRDRLLLRIRLMMGERARQAAESGDFLHGVFVQVLENFEGFEVRGERSFLRWTTTIARNSIRMELRRHREAALETFASSTLWANDGADATPLGEVERTDQVDRIVDALAELDEDHRSVIELRYFEQLSFAEIARRMGRSENAVQLLHGRVILKLSDRLHDAEG